jgi:hypothetical protein
MIGFAQKVTLQIEFRVLMLVIAYFCQTKSDHWVKCEECDL